MTGESETRADRVLAWTLVAVLGLWFAWTLTITLGGRTLYMRDVLLTHALFKSFGAQQLKLGLVPIFNPLWALGQPFSGNPNGLPFYPGNLLYLVLPFWSAFNLHYALHLLLGFVSMRALARGLGMSRAAALLAAVTYAFSGWFLSCLTFYNLLTVAAWWPFVMLGAYRGGRRGTALGGLALGLALLGGEPLTVAIAALPALWLAVRRQRWRRGLSSCLLIGLVGLLIAAPQIVASLRILEFTVRGGPGLPIPKPGIGGLTPVRFLEVLVPFPLGVPGERGSYRYWLSDALPAEPYFFTIYFGIVGLWLAVKGRKRAGGWFWLAMAGLAVAFALGYFPRQLTALTGGLFRYSEKFLFWFALAIPVVAGFGLEEVRSRSDNPVGRLLAAGIGLALLALLLIALQPGFMGALAARLEGSLEITEPERLETTLSFVDSHLLLWRLGLLVAGLLCLSMWLFIRKRWVSGMVGLQCVALLQLFPLARTMPLGPLLEPSPWLEDIEGDAPNVTLVASVAWHSEPSYRLEGGSEALFARIRARDLFAGFGVLSGLSYPLAPDLEGIYSPLHAYLRQYLAEADWEVRVKWLRALGVQYAVLPDESSRSGLERIRTEDRYGVATSLYRVQEPAPLAWWPASVRVIADTPLQLEAIGTAADPLSELLLPGPVSHSPRGSVEVLEASADRWRLRVESDGGIVALRRSFQPALKAWSGGQRLAAFPVNYCLTGIVVPAGDHEVHLVVGHWPENLAAASALLVIAAALVLAWRR